MMTQMVDGLTFDRRLVEARSWWLATELCRRHPGLRIIEHRPCGGHYDCLGIYSESSKKILLDLNRDGSIHIHEGERPGSFGWAEAFAGEPFDMVLRLERGWRAPRLKRRTDKQLLAYRLISALVGIGATARFPWDVRSACLEASGYGGDPQKELLSQFPGALEQRANIGHLGDPAYGFWVFHREGTPKFMIDEWGYLYRPGRPPFDLDRCFNSHQRNLWALVGEVFAADLK